MILRSQEQYHVALPGVVLVYIMYWCRCYVMGRVERLERDHSSLPSSHRDMLPLYPSLLLSGMRLLLCVLKISM